MHYYRVIEVFFLLYLPPFVKGFKFILTIFAFVSTEMDTYFQAFFSFKEKFINMCETMLTFFQPYKESNFYLAQKAM